MTGLKFNEYVKSEAIKVLGKEESELQFMVDDDKNILVPFDKIEVTPSGVYLLNNGKVLGQWDVSWTPQFDILTISDGIKGFATMKLTSM
jgi:hypothetical protein